MHLVLDVDADVAGDWDIAIAMAVEFEDVGREME